ncbi:MAG: exonuclease SbcCD subunit D [Lachnospiraceae bacterium]|jgi:exonuclease SbcD|nr:exonuclease SbcCD subunit D [Lachnospiraceae bacterium]
MRLLHLGDLHLGKTLGDFDLNKDQEFILNQILEIIDEKSVDAVLIAGDVYDKSIPSEAATRLLDNFLSKLASKQVKTFIISGNHDSDDRLNFGRTLFASNNIFISAIYNGCLDKRIISDGNTEVNIYLLPFVKASVVKHHFPNEDIVTYEDAIRVILDNANIDYSKCNILVAHQFVAGKGEDPVLGGSESAGTLSVGMIEKIGYSVFEQFDYVALGHIHSPQQVGKETIRYSGSPLKYSLSEVNNEKSVPIITIDDSKKDVNIELVPLKPMRNMRHIRGKMQDILNITNIDSPDDFIYATLTDEDIINDAMGIFQQVYPNTVKIDYDNSHTRQNEQIDISKIAQNKSFSELITDFYSLMYNCDISEEEMDVMRMVAREAGVIDETN